jgi:hypothetical protein
MCAETGKRSKGFFSPLGSNGRCRPPERYRDRLGGRLPQRLRLAFMLVKRGGRRRTASLLVSARRLQGLDACMA